VSQQELELKAVVDDPEALTARLRSHGARASFRGRMCDRRYDRGDGALAARDEVLRVRTFVAAAGSPPRPAEVAWKGPTRQSGGYKEREEQQFAIGDAGPVEVIISRLGFEVIDVIDRCVDLYEVAGAVVRLEWYPRMDVLVEVEGPPGAIEAAVRAAGLPRARFTPERLLDFADRYRCRTGTPPALNLAALGADQPAWPSWAP
jgi:adenylate cyclase class IV